MNNILKRKIRAISIVVGGCIGSMLYFKRKYDKKYLKIHHLIDENTEILNVYTADYVSVADKIESVVDEKLGNYTIVYTKNAKKEFKYEPFGKCDADELNCDYDFNILNELRKYELDAQKEYYQVERFAFELNKIAPNARMIIHVVTNEEALKYCKLKKDLRFNYNFSISIEVNKEILEDLFEEE